MRTICTTRNSKIKTSTTRNSLSCKKWKTSTTREKFNRYFKGIKTKTLQGCLKIKWSRLTSQVRKEQIVKCSNKSKGTRHPKMKSIANPGWRKILIRLLLARMVMGQRCALFNSKAKRQVHAPIKISLPLKQETMKLRSA